LTAEENVGAASEIVNFDMKCTFNGQANEDQVFYIISRNISPGNYVPIYKSENKGYE
jgi:hypothetical protein